MALQGSGQISLSDIAAEMSQLASNISLSGLSTSTSLNDASPAKPDESQPHGMAEFYSYDHNYSSLKPLMGGPQNSSGKWFSFCGDKIQFFYYHDGGKDMPVVGNKLYTSNRGEYIPFNAFVTKIAAADAGPEGGESYVAITDSTGKITSLNNCEGIEPGEGTQNPDELNAGPGSEFGGGEDTLKP